MLSSSPSSADTARRAPHHAHAHGLSVRLVRASSSQGARAGRHCVPADHRPRGVADMRTEGVGPPRVRAHGGPVHLPQPSSSQAVLGVSGPTKVITTSEQQRARRLKSQRRRALAGARTAAQLGSAARAASASSTRPAWQQARRRAPPTTGQDSRCSARRGKGFKPPSAPIAPIRTRGPRLAPLPGLLSQLTAWLRGRRLLSSAGRS
jgi:hypothetical protein